MVLFFMVSPQTTFGTAIIFGTPVEGFSVNLLRRELSRSRRNKTLFRIRKRCPFFIQWRSLVFSIRNFRIGIYFLRVTGYPDTLFGNIRIFEY